MGKAEEDFTGSYCRPCDYGSDRCTPGAQPHICESKYDQEDSSKELCHPKVHERYHNRTLHDPGMVGAIAYNTDREP